MTHEEKVKYFRIALNIGNLALNEQQTDLMVRLYDLVVEKKGDSTLRDICDAKTANKKAFEEEETPKTE